MAKPTRAQCSFPDDPKLPRAMLLSLSKCNCPNDGSQLGREFDLHVVIVHVDCKNIMLEGK